MNNHRLKAEVSGATESRLKGREDATTEEIHSCLV